MTTSDISASLHLRAAYLMRDVSFQHYAIRARVSGRDEVYLQAQYTEADIYTGIPAVQSTRRWVLTPAMTNSEIVSTAFKMCLTSMEHRTREDFAYKGARIFGPHFDIEDLVGLCKERENAGARNAEIALAMGDAP